MARPPRPARRRTDDPGPIEDALFPTSQTAVSPSGQPSPFGTPAPVGQGPPPPAAPEPTPAPAPSEAKPATTIEVGRFDASDFDLPIGKLVLQRKDDMELDANAARRVIIERLGADQMNGDAQRVAKMIVQGLPDEAMNEGVVRALDLRPYLQVFLDHPYKTVKIGQTAPSMVDAAPLMKRQQDEASRFARDQAISLEIDDEKAIAEQTAEVQKFDQKEVGLAPAARLLPAAENRAAAGITDEEAYTAVTGSEWDPSSDFGFTPDPVRFSQAELEEALDLGRLDFGGIMSEEDAANDEEAKRAREAGLPVPPKHEFMFEMDKQLSTVGGRYGRAVVGTRDLSLRETLKYPTTLNRQDTLKLQQSLERAGYYDQLGEGATYDPGDNLDENTQKAWSKLMLDSKRANTPINELLRQRMTSYFEGPGYLSSLKQSEVRRLQIDLANAGYFDELQGFTGYRPGKADDPATVAAWSIATREAKRLGQPVREVMMGRAEETALARTEYEQDVRGARRRAMLDSDFGQVFDVADESAQSEVGRDLTRGERILVQQFVAQLQRKRREDVVSAPVSRPEGGYGLEGTEPITPDSYLGYDESDIDRYVREHLKPEEKEISYRNLRQAALERFGGVSDKLLAANRAAINPTVVSDASTQR